MGKRVGGEDSKYRCVVKVSFEKTSLYQKEIGKKGKPTTTIMTVFLGPRGGRTRAVPADTVDTLRGGTQHTVVGKNCRWRSFRISSCSQSRLPENQPLLKSNRYKWKKNNNNNDNRVPGSAGGLKNSGSSRHGRHTQGREKRKPSK